MLSGSVDAGERLFVSETRHPVLLCDTLERDHDELLVVGRDIAGFEDGRDFVLTRRNFIVTCFYRDPQLE